MFLNSISVTKTTTTGVVTVFPNRGLPALQRCIAVTSVLNVELAAAEHSTHEKLRNIPLNLSTFARFQPVKWCGSEGRGASSMLPDRHACEPCTALP